MSTSFKVLPSNYTGVTGSIMPVRAELQGGEVQGCPIGESFYEGGTVAHPFDVNDIQQLSGSVSVSPYSIVATAPQTSVVRVLPLYNCAEKSFDFEMDCDFHGVVYANAMTRMSINSGGASRGYIEFGRFLNDAFVTVYDDSGANTTTIANYSDPHNIKLRHRYDDTIGGTCYIDIIIDDTVEKSYIYTSLGNTDWIDISFTLSDQNIITVNNIKDVRSSGLPNQCQGELETYNVELFDNLGVSRDTQVVTGGEVSGCPIGETFYEGGTVAHPFTAGYTLGGWSAETTAITVTDSTVIYDQQQTSYKKLVLQLSDQVLASQTSTVNMSGRIDNVSGAVYIPLQGGSSAVDLWCLSSGEVQIGSVTILPAGSNYSSFQYEISVKRGLTSSEYTIEQVGSGQNKRSFSGSFPNGSVGLVDEFIFSAYKAKITVDTVYWVSAGWPNQCTGEVLGKAEYIYDAPNMQSVDTGEWKLVAEGAVEAPFQVAIVTEGANTITQGDTTVEVITLDGSGVDIALDMERGVDSRGFVQWLDNGKEYDNYKTSFSVRSETPQAFELLMNSDSVDSVEISTPIKEGFFPFGMGFATEQNYPVNINTWEIEAQTYHGEVKDYSVTAYPNVRDIYSSLIESTTLSGCVLDHWQIAGVPFPFMQPDNDHNDMRFTSVGHGDSYQVVDPTREYGESASFTIEVEEEQARLILQFFTKVMRGTEQTATFPASYNLFSRRYEGLTTATVKLFSNVVKVLHISQGRVEINFSLQIVGV